MPEVKTKAKAKKDDKRLINLPTWLWRYVEKDAERCRRNVTTQIEAILLAYFKLEDVNVSDLGELYVPINPKTPATTELDKQPDGRISTKIPVKKAKLNAKKD